MKEEYSKRKGNEMGSFSSKAFKSPDTNQRRKSSEPDVSEEGANVTGMAKPGTGQADDAINEDNIVSSTSQEQHIGPKVRQSFSWLASAPVSDSDATTSKEQKEKGKKPMEGKAKSKNVAKYRNEKYLKSCEHSTESTKQRDDASSHSSSTATNSIGYEASRKGMEETLTPQK